MEPLDRLSRCAMEMYSISHLESLVFERRAKYALARRLCYYVAMKELRLDYHDLTAYFHKSKSTIYKSVQETQFWVDNNINGIKKEAQILKSHYDSAH